LGAEGEDVVNENDVGLEQNPLSRHGSNADSMNTHGPYGQYGAPMLPPRPQRPTITSVRSTPAHSMQSQSAFLPTPPRSLESTPGHSPRAGPDSRADLLPEGSHDEVYRPSIEMSQASGKPKYVTSSMTDLNLSKQARRFSQADHNDETGLTRSQVIRNRLLICMFAIFLLWTTTLSFSAEVAQLFIRIPDSHHVINTWKEAYFITEGQREAHLECAVAQTTACLVNLNRTTDDLIADAARRAKVNAQIVKSSETTSEQCSLGMLEAFGATTQWLKFDRVANRIRYRTDTCSESELAQLREWVNDLGEVSNSAYTLTKDFVNSTSEIIRIAVASAEARAEYDEQYVEDKTEFVKVQALQVRVAARPPDLSPAIQNIFAPVGGVLDELIACLAYVDGGCPTASLMKQYEDVVTQFNNSYWFLRDVVNDNVRRAQDYSDAAIDLMEKGEAVLSVVRGSKSAVEDVLGVSFGSIPILAGFGGIALQDVPLPHIVSPISSLSAQVPGFRSALDARLISVETGVDEAVEEELHKISQSVNNSLSGLEVKPFDDYRPPEIVVKSTDYERSQQEYLSNSRAVLGAEASAAEAKKSNANSTLQQTLNSLSSLQTSSNVSFNFQDFDSDVQLDTALDVINAIIFIIYLVDYLWRALMTIRLIVKYWTASDLGLPVVDVRDNSISGKGTPLREKLARLMVSTYMFYFWAFIFFIIGLMIVMNSYAPVYTSYREGCVDSNNGTSLSRNAYSFGYNIASSKGDDQLAQGLASYETSRAGTCSKYDADTTNTLVTDADLLDAAKRNHRLAAERLELFSKCVDKDATGWTNSDFLQKFARNEPFVTISRTIACRQTEIYNKTLIDSRFNCTQLPACVQTCTGPNEALIEAATYSGSCLSESFFHSGLFVLLCALVVYICINISRALIIMGVVRIFWKSLTPYGFNYMGNVSRTGKVQVNSKARVKEELESTLSRFKFWTGFMVTAAVFMHLPYMIMLSVIPNPTDDSAPYGENR